MRVAFGECVLDTDRRELTRCGRTVPLQPKAFRLLEVLVERRPRVVTRAELRSLVWPGELAGGTPVARLVNEVRSAIGDPARTPRFIRTVHRVGYAFSERDVEEASAPAPRPSIRFALQWGERLVALTPGESIIGRATGALIGVASPRVSRRHARIVVAEERATIEDLRSKNGTFVGGRRLEGTTGLRHGDLIEIGPLRLVFLVSDLDDTE